MQLRNKSNGNSNRKPRTYDLEGTKIKVRISQNPYVVDFDIILRWIKATPNLNEIMTDIIEQQVQKHKGNIKQMYDDIDNPENKDIPKFRKLIIEGILDLKKTMGDEDFDDLYLDKKTK